MKNEREISETKEIKLETDLPPFYVPAICGLRRTVLRSKTDAMRSERTDLI